MATYDRINNYVGILHEWCQKYPSRRDTTENFSSVGPPHIRIFTCTTTVSGIPDDVQDTFSGEGMTKKEAKSHAAYHACLALHLI